MNKRLSTAVLSLSLFSCNAFAGADTFRIYVPGIRVAATAAPSVTYATLNPSDKGAYTTLSGGNLTSTSYAGSGVRANMGKSTGRWYWEVTLNNFCSGGTYPGIVGITSASDSLYAVWNSTPNYSYYGTNVSGHGLLFSSGGTQTPLGAPGVAGETVGVALDLNAMTMTVYVNGVSLGTAFTSISAGTWYPYVSDPNAGGSSAYACSVTVNFGQNAFKYSPPSGYNAGWYQ